jgi:hypothetical protein
MRARLLALGAVALVMCGAPVAAQAPTAAQVAAQARTRWEQRLRDVRNYTVTQQVLGVEMIVYFERQGGPTGDAWRSRVFTRGANGALRQTRAHTSPFPFEQLRLFRDHAAQMRFEGTSATDGKQALVLAVDGADLGDLAPGMPLGGRPEEVRNSHARLFLDPQEYVPLKVSLTLGGAGGAASSLTVVARFSDYRPVGAGLVLPFRTTFSPDTGDGTDGGTQIAITVRDVKVNAGPPPGAPR